MWCFLSIKQYNCLHFIQTETGNWLRMFLQDPHRFWATAQKTFFAYWSTIFSLSINRQRRAGPRSTAPLVWRNPAKLGRHSATSSCRGWRGASRSRSTWAFKTVWNWPPHCSSATPRSRPGTRTGGKRCTRWKPGIRTWSHRGRSDARREGTT